MAIDLATGSGGQRTSRSGRSNAANLDTGQARVRSGTSQREVRVTGAGAIEGKAAVANAVSAFFPALQEAARLDEEQEVRDIKVENADAVIALEAEVMKDREGAREAIRTGDYSKFIPDNEIARRRVIQNSFQSTVAKQMAHEDFDTRVKDIIKQTPLDQNPEDAVDEFLKTQTMGASSLFARDYAATIKNRSTKDIAQFRESRLTLQQAQAERQGVELVTTGITTGTTPLTVEGLDALRLQLIGGLPMNAADAVIRGGALFDNAIISMAASGSPAAIKMLEMADPNRDGTSVASRNPGAYQKAVNSAIQNMESTASVQAHLELEGIEERLALAKAGRGGDDTLQDMWADLQIHRETHGDSSDYDSLRDKFAVAFKEKGLLGGQMNRMFNGLLPQMSQAEWDKSAPAFWDGTAAAEFEAMGMSPGAAQARALEMLARRGSGKQMRDTNSSRLLNSTDASEVMEAYQTLRTLDKAGNLKLEGNHLSKEALSMYYLMNYATAAGMDPMQMRADHLKALELSPEADPRNHFEDRLRDPGDPKSARVGNAGVVAFAKEVWKDLDDENLEIEGLIFDHKPNFDSLSPAAQARISKAINLASFQLSGVTGDEGEISKLAQSMLRNQFGVELGPDLEERIAIDQTPEFAVNEQGTPVQGQKVTTEVAQRLKEDLESDKSAVVMSLIGAPGGVVQDQYTAQGMGLAVRTSEAGFPQEVRIAPNASFSVDADQIPQGALDSFFVESRDGDTVTLKAPPPPGPNDPISKPITDTVSMLFNRETGAWEMRMMDKGATKMTLGELNKRNQASREAATPPMEDAFGEIPKPTFNPVQGLHEQLLFDREMAKRHAPVGSPVPGPNDHGPYTLEDHTATKAEQDSVVDTLQSRGILSPQAALADTGGSLEERTKVLFETERSTGGWLNDMTKPANEQALSKVAEVLEQHEGRVSYVYDDNTSRRWSSKAKGDPTIGIGFNLNRPDARKLIGQVGGDFDRLMAGKDTLNPDQIDQLTGLAVRETANWLRNHFDGVVMENAKWMALTSLAYNSRWNKAGPTLIGPKITAAIKRGDWKAAEDEIRHNSSGGVSNDLKRGIQLRRDREANLFRGTLK